MNNTRFPALGREGRESISDSDFDFDFDFDFVFDFDFDFIYMCVCVCVVFCLRYESIKIYIIYNI